jgi:hypothetical protein
MTPQIFISSFSTEDGQPLSEIGAADDPLKNLRFSLFELGNKHGGAIWVAEQSVPALGGKLAIERVNHCLKKIEACTHVIVLLAGQRRGNVDHGTQFERECAASYVELEWLYATARQKPLIVFQLPGFDPGPRLLFILNAFGIKNVTQATGDIIVQTVKGFLESPDRLNIFHRGELKTSIESFYVARKAEWEGHNNSQLFLRGMREDIDGEVSHDRIKLWMQQGIEATDARDRLVWYWAAYRELMRRGGGDEDFLPWHNQVLARWSAAAAWCGLHAHIYLGDLAAIGTYDQIRKRMRERGVEPLDGDTTQPAYGAWASAYHSLSKLCNPLSPSQAYFRAQAELNVRLAIDEHIAPESQLRSFYSIILLVQGRAGEAAEQAQLALKQLKLDSPSNTSERGTILCDIGGVFLQTGNVRKKIRGVSCLAEGVYLLNRAARSGDGAAADFQRRNFRRLKHILNDAGAQFSRVLPGIFD